MGEKYMWFLGILIALNGAYFINYTTWEIIKATFTFQSFLDLPNYTVNFQEREFIETNSQVFTNTLIVILILFLLLAIIIKYISSRATAGIIHSASMEDNNEKSNFKLSWSKGKNKAWNLFFQSIILNIPLFLIIVLIIITNLLIKDNITLSTIIYITLGILGLLVLILTSIISQLSSKVAVLEDKNVFNSIQVGFNIFKNNIKRILLSFLSINLIVYIPIYIIYSIIIFLLISVALMPATFFSLIIGDLFSDLSIKILIAITSVSISFYILTSILSALITSLVETYWTIVYKRIKVLN